MRTSFTTTQLRTLNAYFGTNQNPDGNDFEELEQKIGLSKRVLQVWFQNARAKWRKKISRGKASPAVVSAAGRGSTESCVPVPVATANPGDPLNLTLQPNIHLPSNPFRRHPDIPPPPALPPHAGFKYWR